ncbi:MAG: hypothetical protein JW950_07495 [Deltaproteobacteria bacterium]|nr:hypothetical protein [Deltaproteobacteria bacterium]
MPRYILVEIAKSKQERGLLARYRVYREKLLFQQALKYDSRTNATMRRCAGTLPPPSRS